MTLLLGKKQIHEINKMLVSNGWVLNRDYDKWDYNDFITSTHCPYITIIFKNCYGIRYSANYYLTSRKIYVSLQYDNGF